MVDGGYLKRDFVTNPIGEQVSAAVVETISRKDWPELIRHHEKNKSSCLDVHYFHDVPILNQAHLKYCWLFCVAAGVANRLAHQGIDPVPTLSATATAARVKKYRNVGGYVLEGAVGVEKYGLPSVDVWPQGKLYRKYENDPELVTSGEKNKLVAFSELPSRDFEALASVLLNEKNPRPVAIALPWWKHAVLALQVCKGRNTFGVVYANSYGEQWGDRGFGILWGKKALAHEQIVINDVTARSE
tara:strand:+ start:24947 stop:25678 length:732 start_codon:yes stop_codon:yes gene_type:complete